jgi:hypothetical protein
MMVSTFGGRALDWRYLHSCLQCNYQMCVFQVATTALAIACEKGSLDLVKFLVRKFDVNELAADWGVFFCSSSMKRWVASSSSHIVLAASHCLF